LKEAVGMMLFILFTPSSAYLNICFQAVPIVVDEARRAGGLMKSNEVGNESCRPAAAQFLSGACSNGH
jgi:hypothetical protein